MKRKPSEIEINSQKRIKLLIDSRCGGSQQVFADRVGIGKSSVSQYVNGTNFPTNIRAKQIADVFGVSPLWVMGFDVPMLENNKSNKHTSIDAEEFVDMGDRKEALAIELYKNYQSASPEVQKAVDLLLKADKQK